MSNGSDRPDPAPSTRGLVGFYGSCTVFGIAVTFTSVAWIVFPSIEGMNAFGWFGIILAFCSAVATWHFLGVMRRER